MVVLLITAIEVDYFKAMKVMLEAHSCGKDGKSCDGAVSACLANVLYISEGLEISPEAP